MTLNEMIEHLQSLREELDYLPDGDSMDPEIELHYQSNYPLRARLSAPVFLVEREKNGDDPIIKVAMVDGGQCYDNPYGSRAAWEQGNDLNYLLAEFERENEKDDEEE